MPASGYDYTHAPGFDRGRAWLVWSVAVVAYVVAIAQRTSFGVAGLAATARFQTGASVVSLFMVVQLLVYALMQVPAGVLADRFGSRLTIGAGAAIMCLGQTSLAFAHDVPSALAARVLVGIGDSLTFTSVIKLLPLWFRPRRLPLLTQLVGLFGQLGQLISAVPLAALLFRVGWTQSFGAAAAMAATSSVLAFALVRTTPPGTALPQPEVSVPVHQQVGAALHEPATQLGFWGHWLTGFPALVFSMMWGFPFLQQGEGLAPVQASGLLALFVVSAVVFGPVTGLISQRHPLRRSNLVLLIAATQMLPWVVVLAWPGQAPLWLLALLVFFQGSNGAGTGVSFDIARAGNPLHRSGTATGVVVMGGFTGALLSILLIGIILDALGGGFSLVDFRWAMASQFLFTLVGVIGLYRARARARQRLIDEEGVIFLPWPDIFRREWARYQARRDRQQTVG